MTTQTAGTVRVAGVRPAVGRGVLAGVAMLAAAWATGPAPAAAQEFTVFDKPVQVHGFASQAFAITDTNNYLTMKTSEGSAVFSDGGVNVSSKLTSKLRAGVQIYTRNIGNLGQGRLGVDWAFADYKFADAFGVRAGKVKTVMGLYNDTQDMEFLHAFALLPQSVYPTDLRDATIAHRGADVYGSFDLKSAGRLSYVGFVGQRQDTKQGGYPYLLRGRGINLEKLGGRQIGGDLRWNLPLDGLVVGASYITADIEGTGTRTANGVISPYRTESLDDKTSQFFVQYQGHGWRLDSEYRRYYRNQLTTNGTLRVATDNAGFYASAAYRIARVAEVGAYHSRFNHDADVAGARTHDHLYDTAITSRFEITRFWNVKIEGHFMDGVGGSLYPNGFYAVDNPQGFAQRTNLLIVRTGFNF